MCGLLVVYYFKHAVREMKVSIEMGYYIAYIKCSMHNTEEIVQKVNKKKSFIFIQNSKVTVLFNIPLKHLAMLSLVFLIKAIYDLNSTDPC